MSKSQRNAIPLTATDEDIEAAVRRMYADPLHLRATDPGKVEGNVVFTYLDAFGLNKGEVADLKLRYRRGGLGDMVLKQRLTTLLQAIVGPIRDRRAELARDLNAVLDVLRAGTAKVRIVTELTKEEVMEGLGLVRLR